MTTPTFPGSTAVTLLDVYDDAAPDGVVGGSPHMHLASTECYVVIAGAGTLATIDASGYSETGLREGTVVWFTPGTIHRAINGGGLKVAVIMGNAGLPEAGDAVMTFPSEHLTDRETYLRAASLRSTDVELRADEARTRRDLAVLGFNRLRAALEQGDSAPLAEFYAASARLVRDLAPSWETIVRTGPLGQARRTLDEIAELASGRFAHASSAAVHRAPQPATPRGFGLCGRLRAFDVSG